MMARSRPALAGALRQRPVGPPRPQSRRPRCPTCVLRCWAVGAAGAREFGRCGAASALPARWPWIPRRRLNWTPGPAGACRHRSPDPRHGLLRSGRRRQRGEPAVRPRPARPDRHPLPGCRRHRRLRTRRGHPGRHDRHRHHRQVPVRGAARRQLPGAARHGRSRSAGRLRGDHRQPDGRGAGGRPSRRRPTWACACGRPRPCARSCCRRSPGAAPRRRRWLRGRPASTRRRPATSGSNCATPPAAPST